MTSRSHSCFSTVECRHSWPLLVLFLGTLRPLGSAGMLISLSSLSIPQLPCLPHAMLSYCPQLPLALLLVTGTLDGGAHASAHLKPADTVKGTVEGDRLGFHSGLRPSLDVCPWASDFMSQPHSSDLRNQDNKSSFIEMTRELNERMCLTIGTMPGT